MRYIRKANKATFEFELTNCDGTPVDLSSSTAKFIVKKDKSVPDNSAVLSGEIVNSDTNNIMFQFDATQTTNIPEGDYVAALKLFKSDNMNNEVWSDNIKVVKEVFSD